MATDPKDVKATTVEQPNTSRRPTRTWWIIGGVTAGLAVIGLICALAWGKAHHVSVGDGGFERRFGYDRRDPDRLERGMTRDSYASDSSHVSGVVTAINGTSLTIAGNGTTRQITTTGTTTYYGAAQPVKVNDSVTISGTTSGDTFTANRIMIRRQ